ncbi:MAG: serine/threonine protein kinase [Gammaproteobacteria bacterium]|nr:serine/threonine protein kinase [Gammaproteobacteria bacterium]
MQTRWDLLQGIFDEAVERTPEDRLAFLETRCAGDESLIAEVIDLLEADQKVVSGSRTERREKPLAPIELPGYDVADVIGQGGMATVYLAHHQLLNRDVALKVVREDLSTDAKFSERFLSEGRILARLDHPHIITVYDVGKSGSNYFMAMEYISGGTLRDVVRNHPAPEEIFEITRQLAGALEQAHEHGFLHRDIKPANVLVKPTGEVVLTDFGIAKMLEQRDTQLTRMGFSIGTPDYMSPEQLLGGELDARTDLFSLGIVIYELLLGELPTEGSLAQAMVTRDFQTPQLPERLSEWQPILDKLLARNPWFRFESAAALLDGLRPLGRHYGLEPTIEQPTITRKQKIGLAVVFAVAVAVVAIMAHFATRAVMVPEDGREPPIAVLSPDEQTKRDMFISRGDEHLRVGRCKTPPASSALSAYQMALAIDPTSREARAGIDKIENLGDACQ